MTYLREREAFFKPESTKVRPPEKAPIQVGFKRLTPDAVIPTKAHPQDSGFDLVASADVIIEPGETAVVPTGIAVQLPAGYEATVRPRSGVTSKTKLRVAYGTVDQGYGGEVGVIVDNVGLPSFYLNETYMTIGLEFEHGPLLLGGGRAEEQGGTEQANTYLIRKGDKLAQLVITRLPDVEAVEVTGVEEAFAETARGANGFGSSGVSV